MGRSHGNCSSPPRLALAAEARGAAPNGPVSPWCDKWLEKRSRADHDATKKKSRQEKTASNLFTMDPGGYSVEWWATRCVKFGHENDWEAYLTGPQSHVMMRAPIQCCTKVGCTCGPCTYSRSFPQTASGYKDEAQKGTPTLGTYPIVQRSFVFPGRGRGIVLFTNHSCADLANATLSSSAPEMGEMARCREDETMSSLCSLPPPLSLAHSQVPPQIHCRGGS